MSRVGWGSWAFVVFFLSVAACDGEPTCSAGTVRLGSRCAQLRRDAGELEEDASAVEAADGAVPWPVEDAGEEQPPGSEPTGDDAGAAREPDAQGLPDSSPPDAPPPSPLVDLTLSVGTLNPRFSSSVTEYRIPVDLTVQTITVNPKVPDGALARIDGKVVDLVGGWTSGVLNLGDNRIEIVVSQDGVPPSTYVLLVTRGFQQAYLKASNAGAIDAFGTSVAIAGDVLVVGAPYEDSSAQGVNGSQEDDTSALDSGAAYVFRRMEGVWQQTEYLKATNTEAGDHFGASVAIHPGSPSGVPGRIIVVGAPGEDGSSSGVNGDQSSNAAPDSGAAYVYGVGSGTTYLKCGARSVDPGDGCGTSVAVWYDWIAVGAPGEDGSKTGISGTEGDNDATDSGAVFLYGCGRGVRCSLNSESYVKASNGGTNDHFGRSVALSGVVPPASGVPDSVTLVVGAPEEDGSATGVGGDETIDLASSQDSGAAYVFSFGRVVGQLGYIKAHSNRASNGFGSAVAASSDWIVVGAPRESSSAVGVNGMGSNTSASSGAAYVYQKGTATITFAAYLKATNPGPQDLFGSSVSVSENTVLVGAPGEDSNARGVGGNQLDNSVSNAGAAYTYVSSGVTWLPQAYFKPNSPAAQDGFGTSVAISQGTIVIGTAGDDRAHPAAAASSAQTPGEADASGAAYVFR